MKPSNLLFLALLIGVPLLASPPASADELPDPVDTSDDDGGDDEDSDEDDDKGCSSAAAPVSGLSVLVGIGLALGLRRRDNV